MRELEEYHRVWLLGNPNRSEAWLRKQMADGFDIHHIDGNHDNNSFANLVLIEHRDHMRLHGRSTLCRLGSSKSGVGGLVLARGERAYKLRASGLRWRQVGEQIGMNLSIAVASAKSYAVKAEKPWPIVASDFRRVSQGDGVRYLPA